ncbi:hypothetical protein [Streptomyces sp. NPDC001508]|uniref:hypothetical protein n=1 Tax=Streptomyces sp. NPDC001508 TaxID=3154656 RepID=UPI003329F941
MGETRFHQQNQYVGQQFNADRQEFAGARVGTDYTVVGGLMTVNYYTDPVGAEHCRTAVDVHLMLWKLVDLAVKFRKVPETNKSKGDQFHEFRSLMDAIEEVVDEVDRRLRRLYAVTGSDGRALEIAERIISIQCIAMMVANAQATGRAMEPDEVQHLETWPSSTSLWRHLRSLHEEFRALAIKP